MLAVVPAASGHVHGITPLIDCGQANANAGAKGTDGTAADDDVGDDGGPISGLIPSASDGGPGNSPLAPGDGGFGATDGNCPEEPEE